MRLTMHPYQNEDDFFKIRNFLRQVFLLNNRLEHSWSVARWDYWRWHLVLNCQYCNPIQQVTFLWETPTGELAAVLHPVVTGELRLHIHPHHRSPALEAEMLELAESHLYALGEDGRRFVYTPVDADDSFRQEVLGKLGYTKRSGKSHKWHRDLTHPIPQPPLAAGYTVQAMGDISQHPARSWASWRAFHNDEPDENYDGDWSWYANLQRSPLYRRDLDMLAIAPQGEIASFCTIYYDDYTRSAVCVLVGSAFEHQQRGLGKAVMYEGFRRLQKLGCLRVFATAYDPPAEGLYGSVMDTHIVAETWRKDL